MTIRLTVLLAWCVICSGTMAVTHEWSRLVYSTVSEEADTADQSWGNTGSVTDGSLIPGASCTVTQGQACRTLKMTFPVADESFSVGDVASIARVDETQLRLYATGESSWVVNSWSFYGTDVIPGSTGAGTSSFTLTETYSWTAANQDLPIVLSGAAVTNGDLVYADVTIRNNGGSTGTVNWNGMGLLLTYTVDRDLSKDTVRSPNDLVTEGPANITYPGSVALVGQVLTEGIPFSGVHEDAHCIFSVGGLAYDDDIHPVRARQSEENEVGSQVFFCDVPASLECDDGEQVDVYLVYATQSTQTARGICALSGGGGGGSPPPPTDESDGDSDNDGDDEGLSQQWEGLVWILSGLGALATIGAVAFVGFRASNGASTASAASKGNEKTKGKGKGKADQGERKPLNNKKPHETKQKKKKSSHRSPKKQARVVSTASSVITRIQRDPMV